MRHTLISLLAALPLAAPLHALAESDDLDHLIPPGYTPEQEKDEKGLWLEFEEIEAEMNKSALLVRDPELTNYVDRIVCRVAAEYCNDFRVYVVRNPNFNASMTATGMMPVSYTHLTLPTIYSV